MDPNQYHVVSGYLYNRIGRAVDLHDSKNNIVLPEYLPEYLMSQHISRDLKRPVVKIARLDSYLSIIKMKTKT